MNATNDTIAAISTPFGTGGLAVIRISGPEAVCTADRVFAPRGKTPLSEAASHTVHYGHVHAPNSGTPIDEAVACVMRGPRSFTGEDVVELSVHGSVVGAQRTLEAVLRAGARLAEPGEFTKRAFLSGRIDLSQAEAVADIINAGNDAALHNAVSQLEGDLSSKIEQIRAPLLYANAQFSALVDYPDDEIAELTPAALEGILQTALQQCDGLLATAASGRMMKEGILCVIVGRPNVGKSSLLNALSDTQRAIVTDVEGTTRDVIEQFVSIEGVPLRLIDTAGIRETDDAVEKIGVSRSKDYLEAAQLVLILLDASKPLSEEDTQILALAKGKKRLILCNKSDLPTELDEAALRTLAPNIPILHLSAATGEGLDLLRRKLKEQCCSEEIGMQSVALSNLRHVEAVQKARSSLKAALDSLRQGMPMDLCAIDVSDALASLGLVTGATVSADIVDKIFSEFCVGK